MQAEYVTYPSPQGHGKIKGYLARPREGTGKLPAVLVVHENRGLNPYIEDVVRRLAVADFLAFAPDALTPVGGYPGNDDKGRELQANLDRDKILEDMAAGAAFVRDHARSSGKLGVVGFCFGGFVSNALAVRMPDLVAAVPFYGTPARRPPTCRRSRPSLLLHYAANDERVNAGWPAYEEGAEGEQGGLHRALLRRDQPRLPQRHDAPLRRGRGQAGLAAHAGVLQQEAALKRVRWK